MAVVIDGKAKAVSVTEAVRKSAEALVAEKGVKPGLAVVIVGNDPASHAYVNSKSKMAKQCGFNSIQHTLPEETTQGELLKLVGELNADASIHGILVQLPLPKHFNSDEIIQSILPEKDVDGLSVLNSRQARDRRSCHRPHLLHAHAAPCCLCAAFTATTFPA